MVNVVNGEGVDGDDAGVSRPPCSAAEFCRTFEVTLILAESLANREHTTVPTPESKSHSRVPSFPLPVSVFSLPLRAIGPASLGSPRYSDTPRYTQYLL